MSRIGRQPIPLPSGVKIERQAELVRVEGPKGTIAQRLPTVIEIVVEDGVARCVRSDDRKPTRALHGLTRALLANMVHGVAEGFRKELEIEGVGYRAQVQGRKLILSVGYSHPVEMDVPEGLQVSLEGSRIRVEGIDRQQVGQFAADVRAVRPPEPYKGKGIRYADERIRRKVGKAGAA